MVTARLTNSKLMSQTYENVYLTINDNSNVNDPRSPTGKREWVHNADPLQKAINFASFPYIVLSFPLLVQSKVSCNGKVKELNWSQEVIVRTIRGGSSNTTPNAGKTDMLNIVDDLHETFNSETVKAAFRLLDMYKFDLKTVSTDAFVSDNKEVYETSFDLTFMTRKEVSS